jgi:CubicO group peptidase (beta-lactamase class C family)
MWRNCLGLVSFLCTLALTDGLAHAADPTLNEIAGLPLQAMFFSSGAPGMVVALIRGSESLVGGQGETAKGNAQEPTGRSVFRLGSISKVMAGELLATLSVDGANSGRAGDHLTGPRDTQRRPTARHRAGAEGADVSDLAHRTGALGLHQLGQTPLAARDDRCLFQCGLSIAGGCDVCRRRRSLRHPPAGSSDHAPRHDRHDIAALSGAMRPPDDRLRAKWARALHRVTTWSNGYAISSPEPM